MLIEIANDPNSVYYLIYLYISSVSGGNTPSKYFSTGTSKYALIPGNPVEL